LVSEALAGGDLVLWSEEVAMDVIVERPAALDVHKAQMTACVRVPVVGGSGREPHLAEF